MELNAEVLYYVCCFPPTYAVLTSINFVSTQFLVNFFKFYLSVKTRRELTYLSKQNDNIKLVNRSHECY
jgi:hypothetical protein